MAVDCPHPLLHKSVYFCIIIIACCVVCPLFLQEMNIKGGYFDGVNTFFFGLKSVLVHKFGFERP